MISKQISVGPPFYNKLIIPFLIPFLLMMAIGPRLKWTISKLQDEKYLISLLVISIILAYLILKNFNQSILINTVLVSSAFYLFFITVKDFFTKKYPAYPAN